MEEKKKYTMQDFVKEMSSKEEVYKYLNEFFGLEEDGKDEKFLEWWYGTIYKEEDK